MSDWSKAVSTGFKAGDTGLAGNRGLQMEELLSFEQDAPGRTGVDLAEPPKVKDRLTSLHLQTCRKDIERILNPRG